MSITGHKTLSVYQCYRIVNEDDRREVLERTLASIKMAPASKITPIRDADEGQRQALPHIDRTQTPRATNTGYAAA